MFKFTLHGGGPLRLYLQWNDKYNCLVYYPLGSLGRGYLVRDPGLQQSVYRFQHRMMVVGGSVGGLMVAAGKFPWLLSIPVGMGLWLAAHVIKIASRCDVAEERISGADVLLAMAKDNRLTWWRIFKRILFAMFVSFSGFLWAYFGYTQGDRYMDWVPGVLFLILGISSLNNICQLLRVMHRIKTGPWRPKDQSEARPV